MNIYNEDGALDYEKAADEIRGTRQVGNAQVVAKTFDTILVAALVDIAASLSTLSFEAALRMRASGALPDEPEEERGETEPDPNIEPPLEVGDVAVYVDSEGEEHDGIIEAIGVTEDTEYAVVAFTDGSSSRVWLSQLKRPPLVEPVNEPSGDGMPVDPAELVDDVDADFAGDHHPAAASALEALRALEGKPAKKSKKGGK